MVEEKKQDFGCTQVLIILFILAVVGFGLLVGMCGGFR
jgi:sulfite exporter TauE/SafE